jgi:hypothetical protein
MSSGHHVSRNYQVDYPVSSVNPQLTSVSRGQQADIGTELQELMQEMRCVMSVPQNMFTSPDVPVLPTDYSREYGIDVGYSDLVSSECRSSRSLTEVENWRYEAPVRDQRTSTAAAPSVYDLMTGRPSSSQSSHTETSTAGASSRLGQFHRSRGTRTGTKSKRETKVHQHQIPTVDPDTKALCQRLEKKIESLSQIGHSLQIENTEITRSMKDHGKKLSKVKRQIRR